MTIFFLPREKINFFVDKIGLGNSQVCFVFLNKNHGIVKLFNIVPLISPRAVPLLVDQILNDLVLSFFDLLFVEEFFYLKALQFISIVLYKYER